MQPQLPNTCGSHLHLGSTFTIQVLAEELLSLLFKAIPPFAFAFFHFLNVTGNTALRIKRQGAPV